MRLAHRYSLTIVVAAFLLLAIFAMVPLAGCAPHVIVPVEPGVNSGHNISRYVDAEAGVVCWVYNPGQAGGISCLPIAETRLDQ